MNRITHLAAMLGLALVIAACTPAPTELWVESRSPARDATGVPVDTVVTVTFNTAVSVASLDGNFGLTRGDDEVDGVVTYDAASRAATFTPDATLAYGTRYVIRVGADVTAEGGFTLGRNRDSRFTTEAAPTGDGEIGAVTVTPTTATLAIGDSVDLSADVAVVSGSPSTAVTWSSSDSGIAEVDATGSVTAVAAGSATITATSVADTSVSGSATITVAAPLRFVSATAYAPYQAFADVNDAPFSIDFPEVSGGLGPYTFALASGALPDDFVTTEILDGEGNVPQPSETYSVSLDADTGEISGVTGFPGVFTGTVEVTDAVGQTLSAPFTIDLDLLLSYTGDTAFEVPQQGEVVVVNGDRVRVSGISMPQRPDTGMTFTFELVFDAADSSGDADPADFAINLIDGTVSKMEETPGAVVAVWAYDVIATHDASGKVSEPFRFEFSFEGEEEENDDD